MECLKENYAAKKPLTQSCINHLTTIMEQQALHYELDPVLVSVCDAEVSNRYGVKFCWTLKSKYRLIDCFLCDCNLQIREHCSAEAESNSQGQVEECLKRKFDALIATECRRHIALMISVVQVDIQADPLLHRACAIDLVTFCKEVPPGEGRSNQNAYTPLPDILKSNAIQLCTQNLDACCASKIRIMLNSIVSAMRC